MNQSNQLSPTDLMEELFDDQARLIERLRVHKSNYHKLAMKQAKYGIDVPLWVENQMEDEEHHIQSIEKGLTEIEEKMAEIQSQAKPSRNGQNSGSVGSSINIDGVEYSIVAPYPLLGSISTSLPGGEIINVVRYCGGFESRIQMLPNGTSHASFYLHGRKVAPALDRYAQRLVIPIGASIAIPGFTTNMATMETFENITEQRIADGRWTVISPSKPCKTNYYTDWPQGSDNYITTFQMIYENGYEMWTVAPPLNQPWRIWLYINDWNVPPVIDEKRLAISFPQYQ